MVIADGSRETGTPCKPQASHTVESATKPDLSWLPLKGNPQVS
jgi:hypothetical protein